MSLVENEDGVVGGTSSCELCIQPYSQNCILQGIRETIKTFQRCFFFARAPARPSDAARLAGGAQPEGSGKLCHPGPGESSVRLAGQLAGRGPGLQGGTGGRRSTSRDQSGCSSNKEPLLRCCDARRDLVEFFGLNSKLKITCERSKPRFTAAQVITGNAFEAMRCGCMNR